MRRRRTLLLTIPLLLAASGPVQPVAEPVHVALKRAPAEATAADAQVQRLEQIAERAGDEAAKLKAQQAAAAQGIAAAEARITAADAYAKLISAQIASRRQQLEQQQRPAASLLAGLAMMARRPPLVALVGDASSEELVRLRLLLDATLPIIQQRTAALSAELARGERLEQAALQARAALQRSREELNARREQFARLEAQALRSAQLAQGGALAAGDVALASGEDVARLASEAERARSGQALAAELAQLGPAALRPGRTAPSHRAPFAYQLPATGPVLQGLAEVSPNGVRSRGITIGVGRGAQVLAPAAGVVRFAGPFRDYDGVAIIDHGGGWISLIVNIAPSVQQGAEIRGGDRLGRALGPLGVELSHNGQHLSPALIAGSSASLSKTRKGG
jgi:septal ring factor EnvC (AmiA/AmiB activator)